MNKALKNKILESLENIKAVDPIAIDVKKISSLTDLILQKLLRVKQIEDNHGETLISEGIDANYQDIINYSVFALILIDGSNEAI